ncbi:crosslink repair DNA glycosylase YcaQ family protein [Polymorphospora sp. NPDC051019]|uniref:DNA glycosylase AlkZ-like family protein n=1 Tax=Polymorphospora sp. NPDC051019 TaxID=3155725 RepID=UPI00342A2EE9
MRKGAIPIVRLVTDEERPARLGVRHALAQSVRVQSPEDAARAVVCLHATDPPSVHLSCWARAEQISVEDVERALYDTRSLVRQQAMRETLFVFPPRSDPSRLGKRLRALRRGQPHPIRQRPGTLGLRTGRGRRGLVAGRGGRRPGPPRRRRAAILGTKAAVRTALEDLGAQGVTLEDGSIGWLRKDDLDPVTAPESWVALLPLLDPTVMGWKGRDFFLGPHAPQLFDSAGNAGTTVWVDRRVAGAWIQDADGVVQLRLLEEVTPPAHKSLRSEARRLTEWLDGQRVFTVYPSPAMQSRSGS